MAQIQFSALVNSAKGKLNGSYFAKGKGGTKLVACSTRMTKADSGRTSLQDSQNKLSAVAKSWGAVSEANKTIWKSVASSLTYYNKSNEPYTPSGYEYFQKQNLNLASVNVNGVVAPSYNTVESQVEKTNITVNSTGKITLINTGLMTGDDTVKVSMSSPQGMGVSRPNGGYRIVWQGTAENVNGETIENQYRELFGSNYLTANLFVKIEAVNTISGNKSQSIYLIAERII